MYLPTIQSVCCQVVLSHTPFRSLAASLGNEPILVAGMGEVAHVAGSYGFRHVVTTADLASAAHLRDALPFWSGRSGARCPWVAGAPD